MANVEIVTSQVSFTIGYASKPLADIPVEIASTTITLITNDGSNQVLTTRSQTGFSIADTQLRTKSLSSVEQLIKVDNAVNVKVVTTSVVPINTTSDWFNYVGPSPDFLGNTGSINFTGIGANAFIPIGTPGVYDFIYDVPGTYFWTCPANVYVASAVCIGGGGGGNANWSASAGSGGGLGWKNDIPVIPGQQYYVSVGAGGTYGASSNAAAGGNSMFRVTPGDPMAGLYDQAYTTPGTYTWVCPAGITSVSVVAVGGGGGGGFTWSSGGGGGGGLGWKNNIAVTPGQSYTIVVGAGGPSLSNAMNAGSEGGNSYFIDTATVCGFGGGRGGSGSTSTANGYGGGFVGDGGGRGGNGAYDGSWTRAGAGAGGYSGAGADSGNSTGTAAPTGSGGGGAGGYYSSTYGVPAGGGVGIYGRGADGVARGNYLGGGGGSGGGNGTGGEGSGEASLRGIRGGAYGGGGGGSGTSYGGGPGGDGAVRIIAGGGRSFPINAALAGIVITGLDIVGYGGGNQTSGADTNGPNKNTKGGGYQGEGGGAGGHAADYQGGGGAGGYTGRGGDSLVAGAGGGGAGGRYYSSTFGSGAGGGTGIFGLGTSGALNAATGGGGGGGSGGTAGGNGEMVGFTPTAAGTISGGIYGGGGGGSGTTRGGGSGGSGAVRIVCKVGSVKEMIVTANGYSVSVSINS